MVVLSVFSQYGMDGRPKATPVQYLQMLGFHLELSTLRKIHNIFKGAL